MRDRSQARCVLVQPQVATVLVIVADVSSHESDEMKCAENHDVLKELATAAADPPLRSSVLPWAGCLRCLLLVMCTHPFAKKALTLHLARSEGHERYFGCNLMHRKILASSHQHLMAEAPTRPPRLYVPLRLYAMVASMLDQAIQAIPSCAKTRPI